MCTGDGVHNVEGMKPTTAPFHFTQAAGRRLRWPLIIGLGALALVRPAVNIVYSIFGATHGGAVPISITIAVSIVWIAVVGLRRIAHPLPTLVLAGVTYGVLAIILSAVASPIVSGHLDGPVTHPIAIGPTLVVNAIWGLITGALALALQQLRGARQGSDERGA